MDIPKGMEERKYDPCPFRCSRCGQRGEMEAEVPSGFERLLVRLSQRVTHARCRTRLFAGDEPAA